MELDLHPIRASVRGIAGRDLVVEAARAEFSQRVPMPLERVPFTPIRPSPYCCCLNKFLWKELEPALMLPVV